MTVPHPQEDLPSTETIPSAPVAESVEERLTQPLLSASAPGTNMMEERSATPMTGDDESKKTDNGDAGMDCCDICLQNCECLNCLFYCFELE